MEFKKLSDVTLAESTSESTNILIEDGGEIKKVAMDKLIVPQEPQKPQVQANWNETDESSPAYILNKPEKLGGYTYFAISENGFMFKTDGLTYPANINGTDPNVSRAEFEEAYKTSPIMLVPRNDAFQQGHYTSITPCPCIWYRLNTSGYPHITFMSYDGYFNHQNITFSDGDSFTS